MTDPASGRTVPFVRRVRVRNFRSIAGCDVRLGPLTVLLGFNASGKTNFLDALRFVADALEDSPAQAVEARGGLDVLLHRVRDTAADSFEIWLDLRLPGHTGGIDARYGFEIGRDPTGKMPVRVLQEAGQVALPDGPMRLPLEVTRLTSRLKLPASATNDDEPQAVLEGTLRAMRFHELDSTVLGGLAERRETAPTLGAAGEHLGRVLGDLAATDHLGKERLDAYVSVLVPGALGVDERREGRYSTVQARFRAGEGDDDGETVFLREELSEGTLRAAGVLAALFQRSATTGRIPLVAIEEPETALHPAGVGALYEALDDASERTQVIVTSQSSDLLDSEYARLDHIRAVANVDGVTTVGEVDTAGRAVVEKELMSISELHRSGQLRPEHSAAGLGPGEGGTG